MGWGTGNIGGGSGGLNFKVVGNPQPANPKENTIWLNTDVKITGHHFRTDQPDGMAEGEVWISTGTASQVAFNALKKGTVMVYPLAAKQMQGGALVDVTAKSYQDGEWVDWVEYLFTPGTGETIPFVSRTELNAQINVTPDVVKIQSSSNSNGVTVWETEEKYDVTNLREIIFVAKCTSILASQQIFLPSFIASPYAMVNNYTSVTRASSVYLEANNVVQEYILDVSNLSGSYYIGYMGIGSLEIYQAFGRT